MPKTICITDYIEHLIRATDKVFEGTTHENDWLFFHDALSLMTAKDTVKWMKQQQFKGKSYYDRWILPCLGLHQDEEGLKRYHCSPVGNSPENIPMDETLNRDTHTAVNRHVAWTAALPIDDERKFDLSTPLHATRA